jgi:hypothetical protein
MKKRTLFWVALIALVPLCAWAGMTAITDTELQNVKGQTGITISMDASMGATGMAWYDSDGYATSTSTAGAVILSDVTLPSTSITGLQIDAGTESGTSYLYLTNTGGNIVTGDMTIGDLIIGSNLTSSSASLGEFQITGCSMTFTQIKISGH